MVIEDFRMDRQPQSQRETHDIAAEDAADAISIAAIRLGLPDKDGRTGRPCFLEQSGPRLHWRQIADIIPVEVKP
jgi:hypothetical protein